MEHQAHLRPATQPDGRRPLRVRPFSVILSAMRHRDLLRFCCTALAIAHLRSILLTQWTCRGCRAQRLDSGEEAREGAALPTEAPASANA
jgi:hypothetical protein